MASLIALLMQCGVELTATKVLWGQIVVVFAIVLAAMGLATQWTAWRLGFQPQLGLPWFEIAGAPVYLPLAFFWWWYRYDGYAPPLFMEGAAMLLPAASRRSGSQLQVGVASARGQDHHDLRLGARVVTSAEPR